jgi:hypothetical protein
MSVAEGGALRERLTVCSLVLPVLNLPALLLGGRLGLSLGVDVVGVYANPVCFALAQSRRKQINRVFHCPWGTEHPVPCHGCRNVEGSNEKSESAWPGGRS